MTPRPDIRIVHLCDAPAAAPTLARWFVEEWAPWYGPDGPGDAAADLAACRSRDAMPLCLVALRGDEVLGTAGLKPDSLGGEHAPGPWIAALLVGRAHRGHGVGTALVATIEAEARRLGFPALYISTDTGEAMLSRRGWSALAATASLRGPITVYRLGLRDRAR